jgi:hypothetical protein
MENVSNISSEEELLQLRNEGKISEIEYEELRETLQKTTNVGIGEGGEDNLKPVSARTSGLAIASLVFSLIGPIGSLPAVICGHIALRKIRKEAGVQGRGLALAGLIIGYVVLGFSLVLTIPFLLFLGLRTDAVSEHKDVDRIELQNAKIEIATSELKHYSLDNTEGLIALSEPVFDGEAKITIDEQISSDGNGSLRIEATDITVIRMFETGNIDVENARLIYQAKLRAEDVKGRVYISMRCYFPRGESYSSKALASPLTGTTDWTTQETFFLLKKGEKPDNVRLELNINGEGTVWIDDIRLLKGPPQ